MDKQDRDGGRFVAKTTLDDVLDVFDEVRGPVVTSADVSDALDCSRDTARRKLRELEADGKVEQRETAARIVWWKTETVTGTTEHNELTKTDDEPVNVVEQAETVDEDIDEEQPTDLPTSAAEVDVTTLDLSGQGKTLEDRQDAVSAVLDVLETEGQKQAADLKEIAWQIDSATYGDAESLWKNCVYDALSSLDVVESSGTSGRWMWVGEN